MDVFGKDLLAMTEAGPVNILVYDDLIWTNSSFLHIKPNL